MILTIFGATGMVGKELVRQALLRGHSVRAFGRNVFTAGFPENPALELIQGALFDDAAVEAAIKGSDAVLSAIGGSVDGTDRARSLGMEKIAGAMNRSGVKRIIAVGGMGVLEDSEGNILLRKPGYPAVFLAVGEEHFKAYSTLRSSALEWTFVCCPDILPGEAKGTYLTKKETTPEPNSYRIMAADLAHFMLTELEEGEFIRLRAGICN